MVVVVVPNTEYKGLLEENCLGENSKVSDDEETILTYY